MERPPEQVPIDTEALRRLHYAAAIACGVFATLVIHILLTVFGLGLDSALRSADPRQQFISAIAWWATAAAGFVGGWAAAAYLIAAARERELIYKLAQWFLIAVVFVIATVGGIDEQDRQSWRHRRRDRRFHRARTWCAVRFLRRAVGLSQRRTGLAVTTIPRSGRWGARHRPGAVPCSRRQRGRETSPD